MIQKLQVEKRTDEGKPILEITEYKKKYWVNERLKILPYEEKLLHFSLGNNRQ